MVANGAEANKVEEQLARDGKRLPSRCYSPRCLVIWISSMRHGVQHDHKLTDVLLFQYRVWRLVNNSLQYRVERLATNSLQYRVERLATNSLATESL